MVKENQIIQLQKEIEALKSELSLIKENPEYDSFLAALTQMKFWDAEIKETPISIQSGSEEDTRAFDKVLKYLLEKPKLKANLDAARARLLPYQSEKAEQESTSLIDEVRNSIENEFSENS